MHQKKKLMGISKGKSFLLTLVLAILILIYVPLVVFQFFLVKQSTSEITQTNTEFYRSALHSCANSYNEQIELLRYNALNISLDPSLVKPLKADSTPYEIFLTAQKLEGYGKGMRSVAKLGAYYPTEGYVLVDGFKRTMDTFFEMVGAWDGESQQQLMDYMTGTAVENAFCVPTPNGALILARPVHLNSQYIFDCVIFYVLDKNNMEGIFRANLPYQADVALVRADEHWLMTAESFHEDYANTEAFREFLKNPSNPVFVAEPRSGPVQVYQYQDEKTGNTYLAAVPKEVALKVVNDYSGRIGTIFLISLVILFALSGTTIYICYAPLKKLVHRHTPERGNMSELERLDSAFFARDEKISSLRNLLGGMLLGELIYGSRRKAEFLSQELDCGKFEHFAVITVVADKFPATEAYRIAEQLNEKLETAEIFTTSMPYRAHVLFLVLDDKPIDTTLIQADTVLMLHQMTDCEAEVRVGEVVHSLSDVRKSYYSSFVDFAVTKEIDNGSISNAYPAKEIQVFVQCACVGDREAALQMLDKIELAFRGKTFPDAYRQYYAYKLLAAYLSGINENTDGVPKAEMDELMAFGDYKDLFALLRKSVIACCERLTLMTEIANAEIQNKLVQYVDEHLSDMDLCLATTAEQLNMSIYAVSRLFKEGTGSGFKEYVINKRLERAMELLTTTDTPVGEIARSVGFENSTYFSTAFKKHYGISPTQLRN